MSKLFISVTSPWFCVYDVSRKSPQCKCPPLLKRISDLQSSQKDNMVNPFNVKYASPLPETKHTTLSLAFHWKFQNANMSQSFQCKICESSPATEKGHLWTITHRSGQPGQGREREKCPAVSDGVRPRWDRIDVVCLLLSFAARSTVSSDQSQGQLWAKAG